MTNSTAAEDQVDVLKAGMALANLVNYSKQLRKLCNCTVCEFLKKETKDWADFVTEPSGLHLTTLMDQRCFFYQRCNNLQAYIMEEIFEIANMTHASVPTSKIVQQADPIRSQLPGSSKATAASEPPTWTIPGPVGLETALEDQLRRLEGDRAPAAQVITTSGGGPQTPPLSPRSDSPPAVSVSTSQSL